MKILAVLSVVVIAVTANTPYSGGAPEPQICPDGSDCVYASICVGGYIDTSGAGGFNLRTKIVSATCDGAGVVCCQKPRNTDDAYYKCHVQEDCVPSELCHDGEIITDGSGLLNLRTLFKRKCAVGKECCRRPDAAVPVDVCPDTQICSGYDYCSNAGQIVEDIHTGNIYEGQLCYSNPGQSKTTGVCCGPPEPLILECPPHQQCSPSNLCNADGYLSEIDVLSSLQYQGQECHIGLSSVIGTCCNEPIKPRAVCPAGEHCTVKNYCAADGFISRLEVPSHYVGEECYLEGTNVGTCCKTPKPVECPSGEPLQCFPENYCNAKGQLTSAPHSEQTCLYCQRCPVGIGSDATGVCCGPPAPLPDCPAQTHCTSLEYCDNEGYVVSKPSSTPYSTGQECVIAGGYGGSGVCCKPERPIETYCPIDSECTPKDFCYGNVFEATTDSWSPYGADKTFHTCSLPGSPEGGVCCQNKGPEHKCGISSYANTQVNTRFYTPKLDKLEADFGEMPWQAIVFYSNYTFKCGASLISDRHLLTVAHCVNGLFPYDLKIRLGEWQVNTFDEPLQYQDVDVSAIHIHPEFKLKNVWNNLAILELKNPVNFEYHINSICLPGDGYAFPPGTKCLVGGWGKDSFVGSYQHILKKIDVPLVLHDQCQKLLRNTRLGKYFKLDKSYLCAGGEEGKDACVGDGGSPLICFNEQTQSYTQVGITAWGIGCGTKDVPGAYTDVGHFMPWITGIISKVY